MLRRSAWLLVVLSACTAPIPPETVESSETVCFTVSPTQCRGLRTICSAHVDRTAAMIREWCSPVAVIPAK